MLRGERRDQKRTRKVEKKRRKSNRKALQVVIDATNKRRNFRPGIQSRVE